MRRLLRPLLPLLLHIPRWLLSAGVIAAVLWLTLAPKPLPDNDLHLWQHTDKLVHLLMMFGVALALAIDITRLRRPLTIRAAIILALAVIAFGAAIELLQQAMGQGRSASFADLAADALGAILAIPLITKK